MKQSFLFANLIFILYLFTSCGSSKTIAGDATSHVTPIICAEEYSQKYNMQLAMMISFITTLWNRMCMYWIVEQSKRK